MTERTLFIPEMIEDAKQRALINALERLLNSTTLVAAWPAAFDAQKDGTKIPLDEIKIIVLPLDRIGAPAGASGADVYIAYYSHAPKTAPALVASPPLVVKIGVHEKLLKEKKGADDWPTLSSQEAQRFAVPFHLDKDDEVWSVLIAPFHSEFDSADRGTRNIVKVRDLWGLLVQQEELCDLGEEHWKQVERCIAQALDAVQSPHRASRAEPQRKVQPYSSAYSWYMRDTTGSGAFCHIPKLIFGSSSTVEAFGRTWSSPIPFVEDLISKKDFEGCLGAVHGDLHPKNIVINYENAARIIDFGWAKRDAHIVLDYLLLDLNLRGVTLPSQLAEGDILALASFLEPEQDVAALPKIVQRRASIIKEVIWKKAQARAVSDWETEYLIPLLLVGYGLLVYLDSARNQSALVATVLAATRAVEERRRLSI